MKLLIQGEKVIGTASDSYNGPDLLVDIPEGMDLNNLQKYRYINDEIVPAVPAEVTRRQAIQALFLAGILSNVQAAIDAIPDATQRGMVQIEWEDSLNFERSRPTLIALATALGLSSTDLDNLFITAADL